MGICSLEFLFCSDFLKCFSKARVRGRASSTDKSTFYVISSNNPDPYRFLKLILEYLDDYWLLLSCICFPRFPMCSFVYSVIWDWGLGILICIHGTMQKDSTIRKTDKSHFVGHSTHRVRSFLPSRRYSQLLCFCLFNDYYSLARAFTSPVCCR